jgi:hypothetical protein
MSNLEFTISPLTYVLSKISQPQPASIKIAKERFDKITGMNRALHILEDEKKGDDVKEKRWKEKMSRIKM